MRVKKALNLNVPCSKRTYLNRLYMTCWMKYLAQICMMKMDRFIWLAQLRVIQRWMNFKTRYVIDSEIVFKKLYHGMKTKLGDSLPLVNIAMIHTRKNLTSCNNLLSSRYQDVFALLVPSCWQVWNKLLSTCDKVDDGNRLATSLFQQVCSNKFDIVWTQQVVNIFMTTSS